ncbi:N-acetylmuramoyl-L-alanine amidase [Neobacillus niacini]|uniref:cell wall hydrolase n=1 Tax=Neobacillus niacini TaxID=86668 RepID=UPI00285FCD87|nr:cell wall hydrolase [Neobacillus niacini]MDR7077463.1 N-acetylmuramoyl-L-alanine amidase [Neobacillus niacini]
MKKLITLLTLAASLLFASPASAYTDKQGDTMSKIARDHNVSLQELGDANPQVSNLNLIYIDQHLNTPKSIRANEPRIEEFVNVSLSDTEIDLLARLVRAEAQMEPLEGKIAVACVVLNRVESSEFPDTIKEIIYAPGQFQPVQNGEINKPADEESIQAVKAALTDQRQLAPGALFFYNPVIASSRWLDTRATTLVIGQHVFKK